MAAGGGVEEWLYCFLIIIYGSKSGVDVCIHVFCKMLHSRRLGPSAAVFHKRELLQVRAFLCALRDQKPAEELFLAWSV